MVLVQPLRQTVDDRLRHVADHRQGARQVAVEGAVSHGQLAAVAGGQRHGAELVGMGHDEGGPDPGLHVLLRRSGLSPGEQRLQSLRVGQPQLLDGQHHGLDAEPPRHLGRGARAAVAGEASGHDQAGDVLRPQRAGGQRGHHGAVQPAAQAEHGLAEPALPGEVGQPEHQGFLEHLQVRRRLVADRRGGVRIHRQDALLEARPESGQVAVGQDDQAPAVEDVLTRPAHQVAPRDRRARPAGHCPQPFDALGRPAHAERLRRAEDGQVRLGKRLQATQRERRGDAPPIRFERSRPGVTAYRHPPPAVGQNRDGPGAVRLMAHQQRHFGAEARQPLQRLGLRPPEGGRPGQVERTPSAQRPCREDHQVRPGGSLARRRLDRAQVAPHVSRGRVDLGKGGFHGRSLWAIGMVPVKSAPRGAVDFSLAATIMRMSPQSGAGP